MVYNFHHFSYWLKGGMETGQAYAMAESRDSYFGLLEL